MSAARGPHAWCRRRLRAAPLGALLLLLCAGGIASGCAWSNRANRPVWNAFEERLVPEADAAFYATLPLTVPAGVLSILADTFVVHPVQVMDDAWKDAEHLWLELEWEREYYTELALLPLRVIGTPVVLVFTFLARSMFNIPPHATMHSDERGESADSAEEGAPAQQSAERRALELLERAASRSEHDDLLCDELRSLEWPAWSAAVGEAWERAVVRSSAAVRLDLFQLARTRRLPPWKADPVRALRDPSAVVRYHELRELAEHVPVPDALIAALRDDPEEAVRELARNRWGPVD
jgi:hypothetical protein